MVWKIYPIAHIFLALLLLVVFNNKSKIEISNKNKLFLAFLSTFPDIDYAIDFIYGTNFHSMQLIPLSLSLIVFSGLYFSTEKYKKATFLCSIAISSQLFGDMLVGAHTYRILERLGVIPGEFILFMVSFEIIMPTIYLIVLLLKNTISMNKDLGIDETH